MALGAFPTKLHIDFAQRRSHPRFVKNSHLQQQSPKYCTVKTKEIAWRGNEEDRLYGRITNVLLSFHHGPCWPVTDLSCKKHSQSVLPARCSTKLHKCPPAPCENE